MKALRRATVCWGIVDLRTTFTILTLGDLRYEVGRSAGGSRVSVAPRETTQNVGCCASVPQELLLRVFQICVL